jgi:hypothetical protein
MRNALCWLARVAVAFAVMTAHAVLTQSARRTGAAAPRVDCSAFRKTSSASWTVTKGTIVLPGAKASTKEKLRLREESTVEPRLYRLNGVDLVDVLARRCGR